MYSKKCTAIKALLFLVTCFAWLTAYAVQAVGTVTDLSGVLLAKKSDGTVKVLAQKSAVEQGDLLVTEKETYARIKFIDNSEITLRPNTQFRIEKFSFTEEKAENDSAIFNLIKGGLRAVTGTVGKRSREKVSLNTPAATIGIRGTTYIAEYIPPTDSSLAAYAWASTAALESTLLPSLSMTDSADRTLPVVLAQNSAASAESDIGAAMTSGLYVHVLDGMINLSNSGGSLNFSAGQFGYTPSSRQAPVLLPSNPGMQFSPPAKFLSSHAPDAETARRHKEEIDCEVR